MQALWTRLSRMGPARQLVTLALVVLYIPAYASFVLAQTLLWTLHAQVYGASGSSRSAEIAAKLVVGAVLLVGGGALVGWTAIMVLAIARVI